MRYIKHYMVDFHTEQFLTSQSSIDNASEIRQPIKEYPTLNVIHWDKDSDGIDICISEVSNDELVDNIFDEETNKYSVKIIPNSEVLDFISLKQELDALNLIKINDETVKNLTKSKIAEYKSFLNS